MSGSRAPSTAGSATSTEIVRLLLGRQSAREGVISLREVAAFLGVTETDVEQALRPLVRLGVVSSSPRGAFFVSVVDRAGALDICELLRLLEDRAVALSVLGSVSSIRDSVEAHLLKMYEAHADDDPLAYVIHDTEFHLALAAGASQRHRRALADLWTATVTLRLRLALDVRRRSAELDEHAAIVRAVATCRLDQLHFLLDAHRHEIIMATDNGPPR